MKPASDGQQQQREEVPALTIAQRLYRRIIARTLHATVPAQIVVGAVAVVLAIGFVVFKIVREQIVQGEAVMAGYEVDALLRLTLRAPVDVRAAESRQHRFVSFFSFARQIFFQKKNRLARAAAEPGGDGAGHPPHDRESDARQGHGAGGAHAVLRSRGTRAFYQVRIGADTRARYVAFKCADGYSTSLDMATALHPQTQMTFKFADEILPRAYGFPMKIRVPTKLGFKNPKHIMAMFVTNTYPGGYWEDQGYNWFSGS